MWPFFFLFVLLVLLFHKSVLPFPFLSSKKKPLTPSPPVSDFFLYVLFCSSFRQKLMLQFVLSFQCFHWLAASSSLCFVSWGCLSFSHCHSLLPHSKPSSLAVCGCFVFDSSFLSFSFYLQLLWYGRYLRLLFWPIRRARRCQLVSAVYTSRATVHSVDHNGGLCFCSPFPPPRPPPLLSPLPPLPVPSLNTKHLFSFTSCFHLPLILSLFPFTAFQCKKEKQLHTLRSSSLPFSCSLCFDCARVSFLFFFCFRFLQRIRSTSKFCCRGVCT